MIRFVVGTLGFLGVASLFAVQYGELEFGWGGTADLFAKSSHEERIHELELKLEEMRLELNHFKQATVDAKDSDEPKEALVASSEPKETAPSPTSSSNADSQDVVKEATNYLRQPTADVSAPVLETSNKLVTSDSPRTPAPPTPASPTEISSSPPQVPSEPRVAIYMTTHMSAQHKEFLIKCWPAAMEHIKFLHKADLLVYTESYNRTEDVIFTSLGFRNVTFLRHQSYPYQRGAMMAMIDPFKPNNAHWFEPYDWIIRLNPDVMIRHEAFLVNAMKNPNYDTILTLWQGKPQKVGRVNSDFYAFRPSAPSKDRLFQWFKDTKGGRRRGATAEAHVTYGFQPSIQRGSVAWLPNVKPMQKARVHGPKSPVLHVHKLVDYCPNYINATDPDGEF